MSSVEAEVTSTSKVGVVRRRQRHQTDTLTPYQRLRSLKAVLLTSHREQRLTLVTRSGGGWEQRDLLPGEAVALTEPPLQVAVGAFHAGVVLEP